MRRCCDLMKSVFTRCTRRRNAPNITLRGSQLSQEPPPIAFGVPITHSEIASTALSQLGITNTFENKLESWVNNADESEKESRTEAKVRILAVKNSKGTTLNLSNLNLTDVPPLDALTHLKELNLSGNQLSTLPDGCFTGLTSLQGLKLIGCTGITSLPEWVFQLQQNQTVDATNTGIPVRLLEQYNTRQNAPDYRGPRIHFSIRDNQSSRNFRAEQLPQLFQTITGTEANHPFWQYAAKQTD